MQLRPAFHACLLTTVACGLGASLPAIGKSIYRCMESGNITYTDHPCASAADLQAQASASKASAPDCADSSPRRVQVKVGHRKGVRTYLPFGQPVFQAPALRTTNASEPSARFRALEPTKGARVQCRGNS